MCLNFVFPCGVVYKDVYYDFQNPPFYYVANYYYYSQCKIKPIYINIRSAKLNLYTFVGDWNELHPVPTQPLCNLLEEGIMLLL